MALHEVRLPHLDTYNFGVGLDRLSRMAMNQVVIPTASAPLATVAASQLFAGSRLSSTHDLQEKCQCVICTRFLRSGSIGAVLLGDHSQMLAAQPG